MDVPKSFYGKMAKNAHGDSFIESGFVLSGKYLLQFVVNDSMILDKDSRPLTMEMKIDQTAVQAIKNKGLGGTGNDWRYFYPSTNDVDSSRNAIATDLNAPVVAKPYIKSGTPVAASKDSKPKDSSKLKNSKPKDSKPKK